MTDQAFLEGFFIKCAEAGVPQQQAVSLLKQAEMNVPLMLALMAGGGAAGAAGMKYGPGLMEKLKGIDIPGMLGGGGEGGGLPGGILPGLIAAPLGGLLGRGVGKKLGEKAIKEPSHLNRIQRRTNSAHEFYHRLGLRADSIGWDGPSVDRALKSDPKGNSKAVKNLNRLRELKFKAQGAKSRRANARGAMRGGGALGGGLLALLSTLAVQKGLQD